MPQTPQQRRGNLKYAKREEKKMGKPASEYTKKKAEQMPISRTWLAVLAFLVLGGGVIELLRVFGVF
ncbi:protein Ysy6p [Trichomonascus vanleenenianus]|uniref:Ysy6p n=1 Tax=Trichomonascus vanleenenianus TaxID=2268995 RepID=UPI003ECB62BB